MKVPEPRKLPSGTWHIRMRLNGENVNISASNKRECIHKAQLIKAEYKAGKRPPRRDMPTLRTAIDNYINTRVNVLSPSTVDGYRRIQKNRFQAVMDNPISGEGWQTVINNEAALCSPKTLRNAYRFIVSVLTENGIQPGKVTLPPLEGNTRAWLEPEQVKKLVKAADGTPSALPVFLALHSLRRSEIAALTWDSIDLDKRTITVAGAVVQDENHNFVSKPTNKTAKSKRTIPIMIPELLVMLASTPQEARHGVLVDCKPHNIADRINAACRLADVPEVGTHGLRHSFASLAYHLGMSELETMEMGGWSNTQTMHGIYTHLAAADRAQAANKMQNFFNFANKNANGKSKV